MRPQHCDHVNNITLIFLAALFFLFYFTLQTRLPGYVSNESTDWDILIFTQNWPYSVCYKWEQRNGTCTIPLGSNQWTIHGLWPTKLGTLGPYFCDPSSHFNIESIYGILPLLEQRWAKIENHKQRNAFWKHEWMKHGSCAKQIDALNTEFKYFYENLILNEKYNLTALLASKNINVDMNVNITVLSNAVKESLGSNPYVSCFVDPKTKASYLLEIRLCLDKNLTLVDCDGVRGLSHGSNSPAVLTDCPMDKLSLYLSKMPDELPVYYSESTLVTILRLLSALHWITF